MERRGQGRKNGVVEKRNGEGRAKSRGQGREGRKGKEGRVE